MFPMLHIGPVSIQTSGLLLILGVYLGLTLSEKYANRHGITSNDLNNLTILTLLATALGARLAYVFQHLTAFIESPLSLVSLNPGLLDPWIGAGAGLVVAILYGRRKGLPFWTTLDAFTPALAVIGVSLGLSHLASGMAYGAPTNLPWSIELWGAQRHPSQIYEIFAALLILGLFWPRTSSRVISSGVTFLKFVALSAGARLLLEYLRGDSIPWLGGLRSVQVITWVVLAITFWLLDNRLKKGIDGSNIH